MKTTLAWLRKNPIVVTVLALYAVAAVLAPSKAWAALLKAGQTATSIALIILAVFALLGLFAVVVDKQAVGRRLGGRLSLGLLLAAAGFGTVLVGPVYAVYPLLKAFRDHGARWAVIVTIMTAWAVKLPMIPLEMRFLGWQFSLARSVFTIAVALVMGLLMERIMGSDAPVAETLAVDPEADAA